jgi:hypothetical protein
MIVHNAISAFQGPLCVHLFRRRFHMSDPIYKFFRGRFLPDCYQLFKEEQESILAKLTDALAKLGAKRVLLCRTYWSTDEWLWAGVEEFPNIEASRSTWRPFTN